MKILDGLWHIRENFELNQPLEVFDARKEGDRLIVRATTWPMEDRANQINARLINLTFFAPHSGTIGVRSEHFRGGLDNGPHFELYPNAQFKPEIHIGNDTAELRSGNLTARINLKGRWKLEFLRDGKVITGSDYKAGGHAIDRDNDKQPHMFERLNLGVGTKAYGLGERFTDFVKNGQAVEIWNRDGGANTDQAYKNIPFFITNRGWGVFVNHPGRVEFEMGSEQVSKAQFSVPGENLEYYVMDGPEPKGVIDRYTQLTGRPALPSRWSFGLWLTTSFTTEYDEATVTSFLDGMAERDGSADLSRTGKDAVALQSTRPEHLRLDQPLYRSGIQAVRRRQAKRLPDQTPGRFGMAMGSLATGPGCCRFHQPRSLRMVRRLPESAGRSRRRFVQDRLWRAHSHRRGLPQWRRP